MLGVVHDIFSKFSKLIFFIITRVEARMQNILKDMVIVSERCVYSVFSE
jgi:hypothetical protein